MNDLIDRQAAIDAVSRGCKELRGIFAECEKNLNELPSAEPERKTGGWIPCSERLPEKHQMVLTTIKGVDLFRECVDKNFFEALATAQKRTWVSVGYLGDDGWYGADGFPQIVQPIAWMPLPEPWKGGEDGRSKIPKDL